MKWYPDESLAILAEKIRSWLGLRPSQRIDVPKLIAKFQNANDPKIKIHFEEASPGFMRHALASAEPSKRRILYTTGLLCKAINGDKQACEVFLEEIAHVLLGHPVRVANHSIGKDIRANAIRELHQIEEEAEKLKWYLLAPISEVLGETTAKRLEVDYGLTTQSAAKYLKHLHETRRRHHLSKPRALPPKVIEFLQKRPSQTANPPVQANDNRKKTPPKFQFSGYSNEVCKNCGYRTVVVQAGCRHCRHCGDDDGCD